MLFGLEARWLAGDSGARGKARGEGRAVDSFGKASSFTVLCFSGASFSFARAAKCSLRVPFSFWLLPALR